MFLLYIHAKISPMDKPGSNGLILMFLGFIVFVISALNASYYAFYGVLLGVAGMVLFVIGTSKK